MVVRIANTPAELIVNHIEHLLEHLGEDSVAFGSDFDGAKFLRAYKMLRTSESGDTDAMRGFSHSLLEKTCFRNWLRVLRQTWGETA
jgi:membrane dipeptidase